MFLSVVKLHVSVANLGSGSYMLNGVLGLSLQAAICSGFTSEHVTLFSGYSF